MKYFFCQLTSPRPTFMIDIERGRAATHGPARCVLVGVGSAIAFGPVADPQGGYGVAVIAAPEAAAVRELSTHDPVILADAGLSYAIHPMPQVVLGERPQSR